MQITEQEKKAKMERLLKINQEYFTWILGFSTVELLKDFALIGLSSLLPSI